jgi:ligand-binding sensor domain-containing protein
MDRSGKLWFGTTGEGVYCYDPEAALTNGGQCFTNFTVKDGLGSNDIWCVYEDVSGALWLGTADGLSRYIKDVPVKNHNKQFISIPVDNRTHYLFPGTSQNISTAKNAVWSIMQDKTGKFMLGTTEGVFYYDPAKNSFTPFLDGNVINKTNLHLKNVQSIVEDQKRNLWFASSGGEGICRFDGASLVCLTSPDYGRVMSILKDKKGNLWFATGRHGTVLYDGRTFVNVMERVGIKTWVYSMLEDKQGNIWSATELGSGQLGEDGGVWSFDPDSDNTGMAYFKHLTTKDGLVHNGVFCIVEDRNGNLWFGTRNMGLCRYDGKNFSDFSDNGPQK